MIKGCLSIIGILLIVGMVASLYKSCFYNTQQITTLAPQRISIETLTSSQQPSPECLQEGCILTGKQYLIQGSGTYPLRSSPAIDAEKIVNQKATEILRRLDYCNVDNSVVVVEECIFNEWSWIRVVKPGWLAKSHRGWILSEYLDKAGNPSDKYHGKILEVALSPYTITQYPKANAVFKERIPEIEIMRRQAAEMAIDAGGCDLVDESEVTTGSTKYNITIRVHCTNGHVVRFKEQEIKTRMDSTK